MAASAQGVRRFVGVAAPAGSVCMTGLAAPAAFLSIALVGWLLRLTSWGGGSLHPDEALYAYWARLIASGRDAALLSVPVDKPPLFIYAVALAFRLFGPTTAAARLPSLLASALSLAVLFALARTLYGRRTAVLASALYAVSPFAISFAPTVFTDPLLVFWGLVASLLAARARWSGAGLALGLAVATKQQGLLFIPLAIALGLGASHAGPHLAWLRRAGARLLLGFAPVYLLLTWWDSLRWHVRPSFWERSWVAYGGLRLTSPVEWSERARAWGGLLAYLAGSWWLAVAWLVAVVFLLWAAWAARRRLGTAARADLVITWYTLGFLLLHWLLSIRPWDRYLLPLAPLTALLLARGLLLLSAWLTGNAHRLALAGLGLLLFGALSGPAGAAAWGRLPIGGDHGAYVGLERAAAWAQGALPTDATLYHTDLGWHLAYYLFDGGPEARWYVDASALAEDVARQGRPAYVIFSPRDAVPEAAHALAARGMGLALRYSLTVNGQVAFTVYEIVQGVRP